jgi:multiple antibiotic resistance protein
MAEFAFNAFVTLLVVIDPSGMAPVFAALTRGYPTKRKREPTIPRVLLDAAILLVFAFVGNTLLDALGIGLPAFRIAGGVLLFLVALDQIFVSPSGLHSRTVREQEEESYQRDVFVFPIAVPLLAGPGAITSILLYTGGGGTADLALPYPGLTPLRLPSDAVARRDRCARSHPRTGRSTRGH